jgi:hypothetical protein
MMNFYNPSQESADYRRYVEAMQGRRGGFGLGGYNNSNNPQSYNDQLQANYTDMLNNNVYQGVQGVSPTGLLGPEMAMNSIGIGALSNTNMPTGMTAAGLPSYATNSNYSGAVPTGKLNSYNNIFIIYILLTVVCLFVFVGSLLHDQAMKGGRYVLAVTAVEATVIYDYKPNWNQKDRLSLEIGQSITILSRDSPDWWYGRLKSGKEGKE